MGGFKYSYGVFRHLPCLGSHSGVKCWLTAASLPYGEVYLHTGSFQDAQDGFSEIGVQGIDNTGDE